LQANNYPICALQAQSRKYDTHRQVGRLLSLLIFIIFGRGEKMEKIQQETLDYLGKFDEIISFLKETSKQNRTLIRWTKSIVVLSILTSPFDIFTTKKMP